MILPENPDLSIKAIAIYNFLKEYNRLETVVKDKFSNLAIQASESEKTKLYFYHGGLAGRVKVEYPIHSLNYEKIKFKENEEFKHFSFTQRIKILENSDLKKYFPENIDSLKNKRQIEFFGSIKRLIGMRNVLAHELVNLNFKTGDYIESLPTEIIENKTQQSFNDSHVDADQLRIIYSNIIYIYIIIDAIETFSPK